MATFAALVGAVLAASACSSQGRTDMHAWTDLEHEVIEKLENEGYAVEVIELTGEPLECFSDEVHPEEDDYRPAGRYALTARLHLADEDADLANDVAEVLGRQHGVAVEPRYRHQPSDLYTSGGFAVDEAADGSILVDRTGDRSNWYGVISSTADGADVNLHYDHVSASEDRLLHERWTVPPNSCP